MSALDLFVAGAVIITLVVLVLVVLIVASQEQHKKREIIAETKRQLELERLERQRYLWRREEKLINYDLEFDLKRR